MVGQGNAIPVVSYSICVVHLFLSIYELSSNGVGFFFWGGGGGEGWLLGQQHLGSKSVCSNLLLAYTPFFHFFDRTRGKRNLEQKLAPCSSWKKINYNCKLKEGN